MPMVHYLRVVSLPLLRCMRRAHLEAVQVDLLVQYRQRDPLLMDRKNGRVQGMPHSC